MTRRVLVRIDDFGGCESANQACLDSLAADVAHSVGVMASGLAVEDGCRRLREAKPPCVGVHGVLNAEWDRVKWGPVAGAKAVPSLVEPDGMFTATPNVLYDRGFLVDEAIAELTAQINRVRSLGLRPTYLDEHMGVGWLPGLGDAMVDLAKAEGLVFRPLLSQLPPGNPTGFDPVERLLAQVDQASAGDYLVVFHPGLDQPDMHDYVHPGIAPGQVAKERQGDRDLLVDARLHLGLMSLNVEIIDYRAFA